MASILANKSFHWNDKGRTITVYISLTTTSGKYKVEKMSTLPSDCWVENYRSLQEAANRYSELCDFELSNIF